MPPILPYPWDAPMLAGDVAILIALVISKVKHHRSRKPLWLVLTIVLALALVLAIAASAFVVFMGNFDLG
jgi:small neutral amino acid transporter SnatA (MarC family)